MKRTILLLCLTALLGGCTVTAPLHKPESPVILTGTTVKEFDTLPAPAGGRVTAAVYNFTDKTGQRKPSDRLANISYAVTQGAETWLIKALQDVGNGQWFQVVERVTLDELTKERQIIRQARQSVGDERQLKPLLFAGVLVTGGITGYDSNTITGGAGARYLGIGPSAQYRQDIVTVSMRLVSVQTGEVLISVDATKTIISTGSNFSVFTFVDMGTKAVEVEAGHTVNEPVSFAVRAAIEAAVVEMVKEGERKGLWKYKDTPNSISLSDEAQKAVIDEITVTETTPTE